MSTAPPTIAEIEAIGAPCELAIVEGPAGPVLRVRGRALAIRGGEAVTLRARTVAIRTEGDLVVRAGGDLHEQVGGEARREVAGSVTVVAGAIGLGSEGEVRLRANDDIALRGRSIELSPEDHAAPRAIEEEALRAWIEGDQARDS
ncbi:MAG: hypothetical protein U0359_20980 [Byssovorax sp.]